MPKALKIHGPTEEEFRRLLTSLLESGRVGGVFTLVRNNGEDISYSLVVDPALLENAIPLYPLMPANAGKLLSRLTFEAPFPEPVVAVVRPCELRAFRELVKRKQGDLTNLVVISSTCGGVYPLSAAVDAQIDERLTDYWKAVSQGSVPEGIRPTCGACEQFLPYDADMTIVLVGADGDARILLNTPAAEKLLHGMEGVVQDGDLESEPLDLLREGRSAHKVELLDGIGARAFSLDGLIDVFGRCIGCHGCGSSCPICYCSLCTFDSKDSESDLRDYFTEMDKRGGVRVPSNTILYQIGRMIHMSISCVGCGLCSDVCPSEIPVASIFSTVGHVVQEMFSYVPGRDLEEEIPLVTYREDELREIED